MTRALFNRRLRQIHLWLGLAIGAQVGLWLLSGLFMTWFPIGEVRGDHLKADPTLQEIDPARNLISAAEAIKVSGGDAITATLKMINQQPVWYIESADKKSLISAASGEKVSPLSQSVALGVANATYNGKGSVIEAKLLTDTPREYGREGPVWQVEYSTPHPATLYIDATTGEVRAVRTKLWRVFDFMWGLHIMDWSTRENFNSWWIKMTASLAVIFFLAGLGLAGLRVHAMIRRK